jgi:hypothetical protein
MGNGKDDRYRPAMAAAEGKAVDEVAEEALRTGLEERQWQELFAYGRETGRASGDSEADVPDRWG